MMLSTEALAGLRAVAATALPDAAQVQRLAQASDGAGGFTDTYATASTAACRVSRSGLRPDERIIAERVLNRTAFVVYLPHDADVRESDRLVVTPVDPAMSVQTYEVVGVLAPTSWMVNVRAVCAREF